MPRLEIVRGNERFLRSINLQFDYRDPSVLRSYVITPQSQSALERIAEGFIEGSTRRAWRITGHFGTGKSSLAIALAALAERRHMLPKHLAKLGVLRPAKAILPILVVGSREPLRNAILKATFRCIESLPALRPLKKGLPRIESVSDEVVIATLSFIASEISKYSSYGGVLIVIDELGKALEHSAFTPEEQDIYLLQQLAEVAARSGKNPIVVVGLLHQGINAYADLLSAQAQKEWEKVAGRFEEVVLSFPLQETAFIVSEALKTDSRKLSPSIVRNVRASMRGAVELGCYGSSASAMIDLASKLYPIHPLTFPVATESFKRFGQNERSLFNFIFSEEPFALRDWLRTSRKLDAFRIHDFYDYLRANFSHILSQNSFRNHWAHITSVVESYAGDEQHHLRILKTVAVLNLIDHPWLPASERVIALSLGLEAKATDLLLNHLRTQSKVLYSRGIAGGYCLWPHTSVNIDGAYQHACKALGSIGRVAPRLGSIANREPMIARRHYIETGTLRSFEVHFLNGSVNQEEWFDVRGSRDGVIHILLCETEEERLRTITKIQQKLRSFPANLLIGVSKPVGVLAPLLQEIDRWGWVSCNTPELTHDTYAASEVSRQLAAAKATMEKRAEALIGVGNSRVQSDLAWFSKGSRVAIGNYRELNAVLSDICDHCYPSAPLIKNELVNRQQLSSAAAAARMRLIERVFKNAADARLGLDETKHPPELSMYLSVLVAAGIHQSRSVGWQFSLPLPQKDKLRVRPSFEGLRLFLADQGGRKVSISELLTFWAVQPYGIKEGLGLLFLAIFYHLQSHELALYEDDKFIAVVTGEDFQRMGKSPESFSLQFCEISGVNQIIFTQLRQLLKVPVSRKKAELLDVVRPLYAFVERLPAYVLKTSQLGKRALSVRSALMKASEPATLIFRDLPVSCGIRKSKLSKADAEIFMNELNTAMVELRDKYPCLLSEMWREVSEVFSVPEEGLRNDISARAVRLQTVVSEKTLQPFITVLSDRALGDNEWIESLASCIVNKPPAKWNDSDRLGFSQRLAFLGAQYKQLEAILLPFEHPDQHSFQITILRATGERAQATLSPPETERTIARNAQAKVLKAIAELPPSIAITALASVAAELLKESDAR